MTDRFDYECCKCEKVTPITRSFFKGYSNVVGVILIWCIDCVPKIVE